MIKIVIYMYFACNGNNFIKSYKQGRNYWGVRCYTPNIWKQCFWRAIRCQVAGQSQGRKKNFYMKNNNIDVAQKSNNKQARTKAGALSQKMPKFNFIFVISFSSMIVRKTKNLAVWIQKFGNHLTIGYTVKKH